MNLSMVENIPDKEFGLSFSMWKKTPIPIIKDVLFVSKIWNIPYFRDGWQAYKEVSDTFDILCKHTQTRCVTSAKFNLNVD